ncbi:Uncharacterised protein [Mycobacteroides abscessus subsp. massiliense]|nr:Uncharacterised protein [Mycobacteroides abscessus subsp. massiliense]
MKLELHIDNPLSQALLDWDNSSTDLWLVLKRPGPIGGSHFRARLSSWDWDRTKDVLTAEFESWEDFMERQAKLQGI